MSTFALKQAVEILSRASRSGDGVVQQLEDLTSGSAYLIVNGKPFDAENERQLYTAAFSELRKQELFFGPVIIDQGKQYRRATDEELESLLLDLQCQN